MTDLDAIRRRDAEDIDLRAAIPWATALRADVRALLAEVDRLTATPYPEDDIKDERNRILRAVPTGWRCTCHPSDVPYTPVVVDRAAILGIIGGEE
jgi:hypothetical protein